VGASPAAIVPSSRENTTAPTPSLNSDSPEITSSRFFGVFADLRMPMTAIGSVGEISAPKMRQ
jgi:hypothetical protein